MNWHYVAFAIMECDVGNFRQGAHGYAWSKLGSLERLGLLWECGTNRILIHESWVFCTHCFWLVLSTSLLHYALQTCLWVDGQVSAAAIAGGHFTGCRLEQRQSSFSICSMCCDTFQTIWLGHLRRSAAMLLSSHLSELVEPVCPRFGL